MLTGSAHTPAEARSPEPADEEALLLDWYGNCNDQPDRLDLAVVDKMTRECVGEAVLNQWDPGNESCNFRIFIGPNGRDRGLGTEATRLLIGHGFERLGLHRISLGGHSLQPRARPQRRSAAASRRCCASPSATPASGCTRRSCPSWPPNGRHRDNSKKSFR